MNILVISYYANLPGACQAEWLDDKLESLHAGGHRIALVSSISARPYPKKGVFHYRVPSISLNDFKEEARRLRLNGGRLPWWCRIAFPFVITLGWLVDLIQIIATKGVGEGRWSWLLTSTPSSILLAMKFKPDIILSTGGPASAHIAAILISKLFQKPLVVEFQDPLSGDGIGRNLQSQSWLSRVENLIIQSSAKVVYVTKGAAQVARKRYTNSRIECVYPGARNFNITAYGNPEGLKKFRAVHLGSLYATRNFDTLIAAIDILIAANKIGPLDIELINLGNVTDDIAKKIEKIDYVTVLPPVGRFEALQFAAGCNLNLLIQNGDERSKVTIPYKTYDYLNLNVPLLALTNSEELSKMITSYGHSAVSVFNVLDISNQMYEFIIGRNIKNIYVDKIDSVKQANELIKLRAQVIIDA